MAKLNTKYLINQSPVSIEAPRLTFINSVFIRGWIFISTTVMFYLNIQEQPYLKRCNDYKEFVTLIVKPI